MLSFSLSVDIQLPMSVMQSSSRAVDTAVLLWQNCRYNRVLPAWLGRLHRILQQDRRGPLSTR